MSTEAGNFAGIRRQATAGEDVADLADFLRPEEKRGVFELAITVELLVFKICKFSINPFNQSKPRP
jgi:hypothetical protein